MDLNDKNLIGGLDRLVTSVALAVIAVFPTMAAAIVSPWKLSPLLVANEPTGQKQFLLSPGAFFPLSLTVVFLMAASVSTSATIESNGGAIGPGLTADVAAAVSEGDIWKTVSLIVPIYVLAIVTSVLSLVVRKWAGPWWTLRTALRAAFYSVSVTVCWIILTSAAIDSYRVYSGNGEMGSFLYNLNTVPIFGLSLWMYFWFFQLDGAASKKKSAVLASSVFASILAVASMVNWSLAL
ncbi:MAG: hypothetical protein AB8B95_05300 [Pseudohongiellaceae bacterium]